MLYAINLRADNDSAEAIRALWRRTEEIEETPSMAPLNYPPHITLALYDDIEEDVLRGAMQDTFAKQPALTVTFDCIRLFDRPSPVLWAAPKDISALLPLHGRLHSLIDPALCRPYYRPGAWVPHCTVAMQVRADRRPQALALAAEPIEPFDVVFDVGDCVSTHPVRVIGERALPAA
jgi:2'-5' RNA ligase